MISYPGLVKNYLSYFDTPSKRNYLGLGISLVTLIILVVLIYPAVFYIFDLNSQLSKSRKVDKSLTEKIASLQKAKDTMDSMSSDFAVIDAALPSGTQVAQYLKAVENILTNTNAGILSLSFDEMNLAAVKNSPSNQLLPVTFSLTLSGSFLTLRDSLEKIEKSRRVTDVTTAAFSKRSEDGGGLTLTIRGKTYFYGSKDPTSGLAE